jgi:hypothetical protein
MALRHIKRERTEDEIFMLKEKAMIKVKRIMADPDFTCDDCGVNHRCLYAYDLYNIDGACKAIEKGR